MNQRYAIINEEHGWLENLVVWNGDLNTWQPPAGTKAILASEVNFSELPQKPEPEAQP